MPDGKSTFFASPERASERSVADDGKALRAEKAFRSTLDALPEIMLILNAQRQIVHVNAALCKALGLSEQNPCGLRPGELLKCRHVVDAPNGCGTSEFCRECGAVNAILECQSKRVQCSRECHLLTRSGDAMDLRVTVAPMQVDGKSFCLVSVRDISDEKRRHALERIFFHDITNLAGGIRGGTDLLLESAEPESRQIVEIIASASAQLIDEINAQRELLLAERGELQISLEEMDSLLLISEMASLYRNHEAAEAKSVSIKPGSEPIAFRSSKPLLSRVVGNMLKNALEATPKGGSVEVACGRDSKSGELEFSVSNPGVIPKGAQLQLFHRSFSTKGDGRGLGTYSIKLLTERYLKGVAGFESDPERGTKFFIRLKI